MDELNVEAAQPEAVAGLFGEYLGVFQKVALVQLQLDYGVGEGRGVDGHVQLAYHIWYGSDVVLVAVGYHHDAPAPTLTTDAPAAAAETAAPVEKPDIEKLSPAEQAAVKEFAGKIDVMNTEQVMNYGAAAQKNVAQFSETALNTVRTKDLGEAGTMYRVRLNDPTVMRTGLTLTVDGRKYEANYVELGRPGLPHCVVRLDDYDAMPEEELRALGRALRYYPDFPKGANVTFVKVISPSELKAVTYERGVEDFTLACGTGCGSAVSSLALTGAAGSENVKVSMIGSRIVGLHFFAASFNAREAAILYACSEESTSWPPT